MSKAKVLGVVNLAFTSLMGVGFIVLSVMTLIPEQASRPNRLGYYSVCSYAPMSTAILLALSAAFLLASYRKHIHLKTSLSGSPREDMSQLYLTGFIEPMYQKIQTSKFKHKSEKTI